MSTPPNAIPDVSIAELSDLRVAIIHYWMVKRRGGEKVVDALVEMFPQADIFALVMDRKSLPEFYSQHRLEASWLRRIPGIKSNYQKFVFLAPHALEQFNLDTYDLVISSEAGPTKGVLTRSDTCHVCYCHSPMRYIWELYHQYYAEAPFGAMGRVFYSLVAHYLRQWDYASAARVDYFVANSHTVQARIRKTYRRESEVIHPPVDIEHFQISELNDKFYLVVSGLSHYKRIDVAVAACTRLNRRLVVIGEGKEMASLQKLAGPSITFLGFQPESVVHGHYHRCRAFLLPGEEDFGITPVEAQACGKPVIAYGRGGALDSVQGIYPGEEWVPGCTGIFFERQDVDSLAASLLEFERIESMFDPAAIRLHAQEFDTAHFKERMFRFIAEKHAEFRSRTYRGGRHRESYETSNRV